MLRLATLLGLALAGTVLPVFRLPPPDGPFAVGTMLLPSTQIWYPAPPGSRGKHARYGDPTGGMSRRVMTHVRTDAVIDAPLAAGGPFPVVIYINGWGGTRWENSGLLQILASHGYVVAASDQPAGVVDGVALATPMDTSTPEAWARTERIATVKLAAQVAAASRLLDQVSAMNSEGHRFAGRLALHRTAALGFSFGGATASEMAVDDQRIRVAINMDGLLFGAAREAGVRVPYLEFSDDTPVGAGAPDADTAQRTLSTIQLADDRQTRNNLARNGGLLLTIAGTQHVNFSDDPGFLPWRRFTGAGPIDPHRASRIIAVWTLGFLDHALNGSALPDPAAFGEIRLERWPSPAPAPP